MNEPVPTTQSKKKTKSTRPSRASAPAEPAAPGLPQAKKAASTVVLHCLGGQPPSEQILEDWRGFQRLPARALEGFYDLLTPSLGPEPADRQELEEQAQVYCRLYGIQPADLKAALRSCSFLLARASQIMLPADAFRQDLEALSTDNPAVVDLLMTRYEQTRDLIRQDIARESLLAHGKVLVGADWRIDTISASDRGENLGLPVALLTLHCHAFGREEHSTVYVVPETVRKLRAMLEAIDQRLSPPARGRHVTREELESGNAEGDSES